MAPRAAATRHTSGLLRGANSKVGQMGMIPPLATEKEEEGRNEEPEDVEPEGVEPEDVE